MNKICTSIKQSLKLIELGIDVNTADMYYPNRVGGHNYPLPIECKMGLPLLSQELPAWSLAALLNVLPADYIAHKHYFLEISKMGDNAKPYEVRYFRFREQSDGADFGRITHISF